MYGEEELAAMHEIKMLFDPDQQLNPDKIFPKGRTYAACTLIDQAHPLDVAADVVAPRSAEEASATICGLAAAGRHVHVRGAGTKSRHLSLDGVTLSTAALSGIRTYARDDLYVTVGAGTRLTDLQAALAPDGMVPLASPWPEATVGGIVSTGAECASADALWQHPRSVQARVVLPDGRPLYVGRPVMKNVAGYDLVKLFVGAQGSLGLITDVTLAAARPRKTQTLVGLCPIVAAGTEGRRCCRRRRWWPRRSWWGACPLPPMASAWSTRLKDYRRMSSGADVRTLLRRAGAPDPVVSSRDGSSLWADWLAVDFAGPQELLVRAGVAPKDVTETARAVLPHLGNACMLVDALTAT